MNAKTAAQTLSKGSARVTPETLMALSRSGYIGTQDLEGESWSYKSGEIALVLRIMTSYKASPTEAARLFRFEKVVAILQAEDFEADTQYATLQRELQGLQEQLGKSGNKELRRRVNHIRSQFSGSAARVLQLAG